MVKRELLIGCGSDHRKKLYLDDDKDWHNLTTLDYNSIHKPNVQWDLNEMPYPFEDNAFDEIHAYDVLEHLGSQGDYQFFFAQFSEMWRILKPNGFLIAKVPMWNSPWAWGDPSHTRIINKEQLNFLSQQQYRDQVGKTPMSDFRFCYEADFRVAFLHEDEHNFSFALQAIKI